MKLIRSLRSFQAWRRRHDASLCIGFVPTMGALHDGHASLMRRAARSCDTLVVSIFVNPLQFAPSEDLRQYPRPRTADLALCRSLGAAVVFLPTERVLYPSGFQTSVDVAKLGQRWEGEQRRTHFRGVTTVVAKLLNLVQPHRAFFGQKDYQQCRIVQQMVKDLNQDVRIVMCPTVREADGLAMSSRNRYLSASARERSLVLWRALQTGKRMIANRERSVRKIERAMRDAVSKVQGTKIDYLAICDAETLEPCARAAGRVVLLGAIRLSGVRLIDNLLVRCPS